MCGKCSIPRDETEFSWKSKSKGIRQAFCKVCMRAYNKSHYLKNVNIYVKKAAKWNSVYFKRSACAIADYLQTHPCVDCGESDKIVLTFDHVRGNKSSNIGNMRGCSIETLMAEIAKCEVRCANCHFRRTAKQFAWFKLGSVNVNG